MANTKVRSYSRIARSRVIVFEAVGFCVAVAACWVTEWFDPPFSLQQVLVESGIILALGAATSYWTSRMIQRIRFLEGFMVICANCKKVRVDDDWITIEQFLKSTSDVMLSHGMCPRCIEEFYGPELRGVPPPTAPRRG